MASMRAATTNVARAWSSSCRSYPKDANKRHPARFFECRLIPKSGRASQGLVLASDAEMKLRILGMKCEVCVKNVRNALMGVEGVKEVNIDLDSGDCIVRYDKEVDKETLVRKVVDVGFQAE